MKARNLLSGATYGPERLKLIYQAFDDAWQAIEPLVDKAPLAHEAARLKLANLILEVAKDGEAAQSTEAAPRDTPASTKDCNSA